MKIAYNCCQAENHEQQFLYDICIDAECKINQKLLCCFCKDDHSDHRHTALKKFLLEFQQQFKKHQQEEEEYLSQYSLNKTFAQMEFETKRAKQIICSRFDSLLASLKEAQTKLQSFKDTSYDEVGKILGTIGTSENMTQQIGTLTKQIESLQPSGGNSFILKKPVKKVIDMKERFKESESIVKDYVEFNKQYLSEFENQITLLSDQIEKLCDSDSKKSSKQPMLPQEKRQSPSFKYLEEQREKLQIVPSMSNLQEIEWKEVADKKEFNSNGVDIPLFSLLQNAIPKKKCESLSQNQKAESLSQECYLDPNNSSLNLENTKENENQNKINNVEIILGDLQNAGQVIFKALFIDNENVFFVFNDGKGLHYNLKLKSLGHFNTELGSSINDVSYSAYTKQLCFGTKQGQLHIFEFNLSNQAERPLIQKNSLRLETSPILFVLASNQDNLVYTLSSTKNLKVVNTVVQNSTLTKYSPPQSLDKPVAIIRYLEKNQVWICGESGFFVYEIDDGKGKFYSIGDRNERASAYFVENTFLYIVCQKYILIKFAASFQTYNKSFFDNPIRASIFIPHADLFILNLQKAPGKYQTSILSINKGCGAKRVKVDDDEWNMMVSSCPQILPVVLIAKTSGTFRILNLSEKN